MGYQIFVNLTDKVVTADATAVTAEDKLTADGVFIRAEQPVYGGDGGSVEFLVDSGEKVANHQQVALFFQKESDLQAYRTSVSIGKEIESIQYAYSHLSDGSESVKLDTLVKMNMIRMGDRLDRGMVKQANEFSSKLDALIVQRNASQQEGTDYQTILDKLKAEKTAADQAIVGSKNAVTSSQSGYFVTSTDGLEQVLTPDSLETLSAQQIKNSKTAQNTDGAIGKVVDAYKWYFAVPVEEEQAKLIKKCTSVNLRFPEILAENVEAQVHSVNKDADGKWIAVFESGYINDALLSARDQQVEIIRNTYKGIKVPKEALRQSGDKWGVYCLIGAQVVFKEVNWVYQTDSYYIATDGAKTGGLELYDKIIVKAKNIAELKVVK